MLLNIRTLVCDPIEETDSYIGFAKMAQDNGNTDLSSRVLINLKKDLEDKIKHIDALEKRSTNQTYLLATTIADQKKKLTNKLTKVQIAIFDTIYSQDSNVNYITSYLENMLNDDPDITQELRSEAYCKLCAWKFEQYE